MSNEHDPFAESRRHIRAVQARLRETLETDTYPRLRAAGAALEQVCAEALSSLHAPR